MDKVSSFDIGEEYVSRMDIIARGIERALDSMDIHMDVKSNRFIDEKGSKRIEFIFELKEN